MHGGRTAPEVEKTADELALWSYADAVAVLEDIRRATAVERRSPLRWLALAAVFATGVNIFANETDWVGLVTCVLMGLLYTACLVQAIRSLRARRQGR